MRFYTLLLLYFILQSCSTKQEVQISIINHQTSSDTLLISDLITKRPLASWALTDSIFTLPVAKPTTISYQIKGSNKESIGILSAGKRKLTITDLEVSSTHPADTLLNYLWRSGNAMFPLHSATLFGEDQPDKVLHLFDSLKLHWEKKILEASESLSKEEKELLLFQNIARIHSFLMYYGRLMKAYPVSHPFFEFSKQIDKSSQYAHTLPQNILYAYEIDYLQKHDSITQLNAFLTYIEENTPQVESAQFLKAIYLRDLIESPSYWRKHEQVFTTQFLQEALEKERKNTYAYLFHPAAKAFYATQKGEKAANFSAQTLSGDTLLLSHWQSKVVVIDVWATWCGPCLAHRPRFMELAQSYQKEPNVVFLSISIDSQPEKWKRFLERNPSPLTELYTGQGMDSPFADDYLIKSIPKYFIISKKGLIHESQLSEPSQAMRASIERALKQ